MEPVGGRLMTEMTIRRREISLLWRVRNMISVIEI